MYFHDSEYKKEFWRREKTDDEKAQKRTDVFFLEGGGEETFIKLVVEKKLYVTFKSTT